MDESFHFALLRVSISQILKASGFDKCKPSTLNIITDLYIKYFDKLVQECMKCSQLRNQSNLVELPDVTQGLIMSGAIIPRNFIKVNDKESHNYNTKSLQSFVNWMKYSNLFAISRKLNELPPSLVSNLIEKRRLDLNDGETDQEKKKRKYKEKQEFYNQLKLNDGNAQNVDNDEEDDIITDNDKLQWLNYLIEKDLKLGHNLKFWNTALQSEYQKFENNLKFHPNNKNKDKLDQDQYNNNKNDYLVLNIDSDDDDDTENIKPSDELINILPYNLKYSPDLLQDIDFDNFEEYKGENGNEQEKDNENVENVENNVNVDPVEINATKGDTDEGTIIANDDIIVDDASPIDQEMVIDATGDENKTTDVNKSLDESSSDAPKGVDPEAKTIDTEEPNDDAKKIP